MIKQGFVFHAMNSIYFEYGARCLEKMELVDLNKIAEAFGFCGWITENDYPNKALLKYPSSICGKELFIISAIFFIPMAGEFSNGIDLE